MSFYKDRALEVLDRLMQEHRIDSADFHTIHEGLEEIETLSDRDKKLEELWAQFEDIPLNPETECIEAPFMGWGIGVGREEIWHWFDRRYSKGIACLLYGDGVDRTDQFAQMMYLTQLCDECESRNCQYNHDGECRFALVHEGKPHITEEDGCIDYDYCKSVD